MSFLVGISIPNRYWKKYKEVPKMPVHVPFGSQLIQGFILASIRDPCVLLCLHILDFHYANPSLESSCGGICCLLCASYILRPISSDLLPFSFWIYEQSAVKYTKCVFLDERMNVYLSSLVRWTEESWYHNNMWRNRLPNRFALNSNEKHIATFA